MKGLLLAISFCALAFDSIPETRNHDRLGFFGPVAPARFRPHNGKVSVAIYVDRGSWLPGKEHLKQFFMQQGVGYAEILKEEIISGHLIEQNFELLVMPGGASWNYLEDLGESGGNQVLKFVASGGDYIGICAGAFYAVSVREGGYATGPYGIGLLKGTAHDGTALGTESFKDGMVDFSLVPSELFKGFADRFRIVLLGGPSFFWSKEEQVQKDVQVLAEFPNKQPAMIIFNFGKGRVFLSGPHLEIEEHLLDWGDEYLDPDSEWPLLEKITRSMLD